MGEFYTLKGVNPPLTRPDIGVLHPLLAPNGGSLFLTEPGLPSLGWGAGVPAMGAQVRNIAEAQALAAIPNSNPISVGAKFYKGSYIAAGDTVARGKVERTAKGGIHSFSRPADEGDSPTPSLAEYHSQLRLETTSVVGSIAEFTNLHAADHIFYYSQWYVDTRIAEGETAPMRDYDTSGAQVSGASASGNFLFFMRAAQFTAAGSVGKVDPGVGSAGVAKRIAGTSGAKVGTGVAGYLYLMYQGTGPNAMNNYNVAGMGYRKRRSRAFYLSYIEDLTISGRSFAQVDAIDAAAFADAFGPGGRYAGDSYTNPSTWTP